MDRRASMCSKSSLLTFGISAKESRMVCTGESMLFSRHNSSPRWWNSNSALMRSRRMAAVRLSTSSKSSSSSEASVESLSASTSATRSRILSARRPQ